MKIVIGVEVVDIFRPSEEYSSWSEYLLENPAILK
jgi:hypothetical protein